MTSAQGYEFLLCRRASPFPGARSSVSPWSQDSRVHSRRGKNHKAVLVADTALKYFPHCFRAPVSLIVFDVCDYLVCPSCPNIRASTVWMSKMSNSRMRNRGYLRDCYEQAIMNDAVIVRRESRQTYTSCSDKYFDHRNFTMDAATLSHRVIDLGRLSWRGTCSPVPPKSPTRRLLGIPSARSAWEAFPRIRPTCRPDVAIGHSACRASPSGTIRAYPKATPHSRRVRGADALHHSRTTNFWNTQAPPRPIPPRTPS